MCYRFLLTLAIFPLFLSLVEMAEAQDKPSLGIERAKRGRTLQFVITPSASASGCDYTLYNSRRRFRLSVAPSSGAEIATLRGSGIEDVRLKATKVPRLRRTRRLNKARIPVFVAAVEDCSGILKSSRVARTRVLTVNRPKRPKFKKWQTRLAQRVVAASAQVQSAFDFLSFNLPVVLKFAPDGTDLFYLAEQGGKIHVFENSSSVSETDVFLDLGERTAANGERGLLGMAFHPDYIENNYIFVHYSRKSDGATIVSRFEAISPFEVDSSSEQVILELEQPFSIHNGGEIVFGPDGYLYIALGDGGSPRDQLGHGQNRTTLYGSVLRIDVDQQSGGNEYAIPNDNPFVGNSDGFREEIYAYGFRNPFKFSFDSETGELWLGDVGQIRREEINLVVSGGNYGWNRMEGSLCFSPMEGCDKSGIILPEHEYARNLGAAVIGGYVYRGSAIPLLYGRYIFGDYTSGRIFTLLRKEQENQVGVLFDTDHFISSFGVDSEGEIYFLSRNAGKIYKLTPEL